MRALVAALAATILLAAPAGAQSPVIATVDTAGEITQVQFRHWIRIAAISHAGPSPRRPVRVPRRGTARWRDLRDQVMQLLIQNLWIQGEAGERGITVTDEEVDRAFREQRRQSFPTMRDFRRFLRTSGFTVADIKFRVRLEQLSNRLRRRVMRSVAPPTEEELRAWYDEHRENFVAPERRDVRYAVAPTRAGAVAKRKRLRVYARRRHFPRAVFRRRRGVVRWRGRWLAFRVVRVHPRRQRPFEQVREVVQGIVVSERQQAALDAFVEEFQARWRERTACRAPYVTEDCGRTLS
jgi:foldase protein PrsA